MATDSLKNTSKSIVSRSPLAEKAHAAANASFWQPHRPGDSVEGEVIAVKLAQGQFRSTHWRLRRDDGGVVILSAAPQSVLGGKLDGERLSVGDRVYVEYRGEKTSKQGSRYKVWLIVSEKASSPVPPAIADHPPEFFADKSR